MSREQNVPLLLWISAALLAHIATGGGADRLARVFEDRADLHRFADNIRSQLRGDEKTFEVTFIEDIASEAKPEEPLADSSPEEKEAERAEPKEPKPETPKVEPKSEPPKKVEAEPVTVPSPPQNVPPPQQDRRIAVRQHVKADQEDNPNAQYIADEANRVEEETVADITSRDQDDPNPTPGVQHSGPSEKPGNSDEQRIADSEDRAGDPTRAPGESSKEPPLEPNELPKTAKQDVTPEPQPKDPTPAKPAAAPPRAPRVAKPSEPPAPPPPGGLGPSAPEVVANANAGAYRLDPARPGRDGASAKPGPGSGKLPSPEPPTGSPLSVLGLGARGSTQAGVNLNLTERGVVAAVGEDALSRERAADGERRRSAHRGSWRASHFERWRSAIENYVAAVKPGNQTALNAARVPFATYLNTIHSRIHPIFADDFLGSLDGMPQNHPLNEPKLVTRLEIVLDRDDGRVVKMGVLRTSGVTAFDIAALDSVQRGSPYGKPPSAIVSPDGNVYFHWEFHRNPMYACSTMNARPFVLNTPAPSEPGPTKPPIIVPGGDPREQGSPPPPSREGSLPPPALRPSFPKRS